MYKSFFKRAIDILLSLIALPFVLLVIIIMAPFIYFEDKGPVFYNATRRGRNGKTFKMFKLRSMYVNSPDLKNPDGSTFNSDKDPRVTKIGRFMRKTSVDELPQILNVLIGDMSFIGPRPTLANRPYEELSEDRKKRLQVRPGITGYAQAYYRNSITQDEKFMHDCYYVDNVSFILDIKILFQTVYSVLKRENINTTTEAPKEKVETK
ncbi:MAG: sugar transferase [Oscillospiraceae bacterium]|nr:sugar transferase [Oscillospiraceae bacterium]